MQIIQDLVGPCRKHLTGCKKCMYEDYDDYEHLLWGDPVSLCGEAAECASGERFRTRSAGVPKKFEAACPKISQARAEHKRQVELAKYKETLREKEKRHRQEVEELKKRFGVE